MNQENAKRYAMVSGISLILCMVMGFLWGQVQYAMPTHQGYITIFLGLVYSICGVKCSLLIPAGAAQEKMGIEIQGGMRASEQH